MSLQPPERSPVAEGEAGDSASSDSADLNVKKRSMVSWYAPSQLLRTGIQVAISAALGTRVDARRSMSKNPVGVVHIPMRQGGVWFDYTADVGDGYVPTYQVAHAMTRPELKVVGLDGSLPRAQFLLLGGDMVYPTASRVAYRERLLAPYAAARSKVGGSPPVPAPSVWAIPGNHDWYDGLVEFSRLFIRGPSSRKPPAIGVWQPEQEQSFFVLQLAFGWWIWGLDVQLEADINADQLAYFEEQCGRLGPGDRIILCTAEPSWAYPVRRTAGMSNLAYLIEEMVPDCGARIVLELAGDLHHYRHHKMKGGEPRHRIICGMGGAFTHPTHNVLAGGEPHSDEGCIRERSWDGSSEYRWDLERSFPDVEQSRSLGLGVIWRMPLHNRVFCLGLGTVYTLLAWGFPKGNVGRFIGAPLESVWTNLRHATGAFFAATGGESWLLAFGIPILCTWVAMKQNAGPQNRGIGLFGFIHGLTHVVWAVGLFVGLNEAAWQYAGGSTNDFGFGLLRFITYLLMSSVVAGLIFGQYLRIAHSVFHAHANELYSAIASPKFKGFLRLHLREDGDLEIFPVGVVNPLVAPGEARWTLLHDVDRPGEPIRLKGEKRPAEG